MITPHPSQALLRRVATLALPAALAVLSALAPRPAGAAAVEVVEYYDAALDHYFMSPLAADIDALDSGRLQGWTRTGYQFAAYGVTGTDFPAGSPVCRYYIPPQHGDSHFFSASPAECAAVAAHVATDPSYSGYVLETDAAFFIPLPDPATGACAAGLVPVYRLWNQRADSNHRYTTDPAVRAQMIAQGYASEGYGPLGVAMCSPGASLGDAVVKVSGPSPWPTGCEGPPSSGSTYINAEVEPMIAVNPANPANLVGAWQQDRWSDGGARGLRTGYSMDGGRTWSWSAATFTRCSGGNAANGGDYARASDPWVSVGPTGIAYQIAIAFTGGTFAPGSASAVLASRSLDGGVTWSAPATLIRDGADAFDDKESIAADPTNAQLAYAVWDRILPAGGGPTWFSRTTDGGATWEPARVIYAPPGRAQTINNQIVVLPDGTLVLYFTQLANVNGQTLASLGVARSPDKGVTWAPPVIIGSALSIGTEDPTTHTPLRDAGNLGSIAVGRNGTLAAVWQDARFSGGTVEGIAFARSQDGGLTWSAPVQVNAVPGAQALLPAVTIRDDGTYGVLYYDLRNDTADPAHLPADVWLTRSTDGVAWSETHVAGPFDFRRAPMVQEDGQGFALFIGDYQGLAATDATFLPFFVQTVRDTGNLTDVFAGIVSRGNAPAAAAFVAKAAPAGQATSPALLRAASRNVERLLARRHVGSAAPPPVLP